MARDYRSVQRRHFESKQRALQAAIRFGIFAPSIFPPKKFDFKLIGKVLTAARERNSDKIFRLNLN